MEPGSSDRVVDDKEGGWRCVMVHNWSATRCEQRARAGQSQYSTISEEAPESAVAYDIEFVRDAYEKAGLSIEQPVLLGGWRGQLETESRDFQDIILAVRA
jgi:hypothetical protein